MVTWRPAQTSPAGARDERNGLAIMIARRRRTVTVALVGELDAASAPALRGVLLDLIERDRSNLVLDLRDLSFLGAAGLSVVADALACLDGEGMTVRPASPLMCHLFELCGFSDAARIERYVECEPRHRHHPDPQYRGIDLDWWART